MAARTQSLSLSIKGIKNGVFKGDRRQETGIAAEEGTKVLKALTRDKVERKSLKLSDQGSSALLCEA